MALPKAVLSMADTDALRWPLSHVTDSTDSTRALPAIIPSVEVAELRQAHQVNCRHRALPLSSLPCLLQHRQLKQGQESDVSMRQMLDSGPENHSEGFVLTGRDL